MLYHLKKIIINFIFLLRCIYFFSIDGFKFFVDAKKYKRAINHCQVPDSVSEIHTVRFRGHKLYYRTMTTDISLIISIIVGMYFRRKFIREYNIDKNFFNPKDISFIDLGANIGLFSFIYADLYPQAKIIAVEPEEGNYKILKQNMKQFSNVVTISSGVWWREAFLEIVDNGYGSFGFQVKEVEKGMKGITIDSICETYDLKSNIVVKMDVEGTETHLFNHLESCSWLDRTQVLIIETHDWITPGTDELVRTKMLERGYQELVIGENHIYTKKQDVKT